MDSGDHSQRNISYCNIIKFLTLHPLSYSNVSSIRCLNPVWELITGRFMSADIYIAVRKETSFGAAFLLWSRPCPAEEWCIRYIQTIHNQRKLSGLPVFVWLRIYWHRFFSTTRKIQWPVHVGNPSHKTNSVSLPWIYWETAGRVLVYPDSFAFCFGSYISARAGNLSKTQ